MVVSLVIKGVGWKSKLARVNSDVFDIVQIPHHIISCVTSIGLDGYSVPLLSYSVCSAKKIALAAL